MRRELKFREGGYRKRTGGGLQWIGKRRNRREDPDFDDLSVYSSNPDDPSLPWYATVSFWSLVTANVLTIVWAMHGELQLSVMIWVFWCQNIILGLFWPGKVFASSPDSDYADKVRCVCTFMPAYLGANVLYGMALYFLLHAQLRANLEAVLIMAGIMFLSETVSYLVGTQPHTDKPLSFTTVNLFPFARVLPMHLLATVGIFAQASEEFAFFSVIFLLSLKMLADVTMHIVEQKKLTGFSDTPRQGKRKICGLCQRQFAPHETPVRIKNSIICQRCLKKLQVTRAEAKEGK
jgi:hypothetical protein